MREMSRDEWWAFASEGTRTGKLAVVRADGSPHVTPIWFVLNEGPDGDELIFTTWHEAVKGRALRREPRISMAVDDQRPPYSYVHFTGVATLIDDPDETLPWATRLGARYMGEDQAEQFGKRNAVHGEYLVRAKITKVVAHADLAD
ncbi:PPOX class F420-dependent oxidoreductase [Amycolatopsis sp. K13G38]|uniref:PPOX class F420-dependent oxidoreductase n=1 Tax=Amycolatopsis acididurans TaxID=2724524 RepID=A0ABX1J475_9PSEU|nr:PPOX class F420-dependent oxidoreductase [Amycolatopsis acididurans]NKQ53724.1 PPOX class F420-dependent oxidoreductase [Amycolatopsis acididurans]